MSIFSLLISFEQLFLCLFFRLPLWFWSRWRFPFDLIWLTCPNLPWSNERLIEWLINGLGTKYWLTSFNFEFTQNIVFIWFSLLLFQWLEETPINRFYIITYILLILLLMVWPHWKLAMTWESTIAVLFEIFMVEESTEIAINVQSHLTLLYT